MNAPHAPRRSRRRAAGFTVVEILVALTVGLVMVGGFAAMFVNMKTTFRAQDTLSQLQDNERLALIILTDAVQQAGYFPNPVTATRATSIYGTSGCSVCSPWGDWVAGRSIYGTAASGSTDDDSLLKSLMAPAMGTPANQVSDLASLLYAPAAGGMMVTVK